MTISLTSGGVETGRITQYLLKDHLGSVDVITNGAGGVTEELSFDAWGQRRNAINWDGLDVASLLSFDHSTTTRGFTGHEMLDEVGLIHMNGRIYDARLARFVQADPNIDGADTTQGYNRYSYVHNNPLNATDPTGYFGIVQYAMGRIARATGQEWIVQLATIASCAGGNIPACIGGTMAATYGYTGDVGASIKAGAMAGVSAAAFQGIAQGIQGANWAKMGGVETAWYNAGAKVALNPTGFTALVAAQAMAGGVMAKLQGGKFGHGFASAGFSKVAGAAFGGLESVSIGNIDVGQVVVAAIIGGTASHISGGKFGNGAVTAALLNIYNQQGGGDTEEKQKNKKKKEWEKLSLSERLNYDGAVLLECSNVKECFAYGMVPHPRQLVVGISKKGLKHISHHLKDFKKIDKNISIEDIVKIGKEVASNPSNLVNVRNGSQGFEAVMNIGGKSIKIRSVVNSSGNLRSVYPL